MSTEGTSNLQLEIGHVLFIDIVGYSKLLIDDQRELQQQLNQVVRDTAQFRAAEAAGKLVRLPTGDGMALVFFTNAEAPVQCALEITENLQKNPDPKETPQLKGNRQLTVRMGINTGPVSGVTDVNDKSNIAGAGINMAQRVMDIGDAGHILLSKRAAEDLAQYRRWEPHLHDLGDIEVKHGVKISVVNLHTDKIGNREVPEKLKQSLRKQSARKRVKRTFIALAIAAAVAMAFLLARMVGPSLRDGRQNVTTAPHKSVAVLPFENLSTQEENAVFAGGVHREVLSNLARVQDLKVISRTSVMQYKAGAPRNLKEIARELGVSHVVEGTVQRAGERVRITAQLIDASTDSHVWTETYDRELTDVFAIQSEIAQRITDQLGAHLSALERTALAKKPTQNLEAFDDYTRARALMETPPENFAYEENMTKAVGLLEQAVVKDPQFSLAYSVLAEANIQLYRSARQNPKFLAQANAALQEAHRLAPEAGEPHFAQALFYYYGDKDFNRALATLEVAARSLPNNAQIFTLRGLLERRMGRWEEALRHFKQAIELDPKDSTAYRHAAGSASALRRYEEAHRILNSAIAAFPAEVDGFRAWQGFLSMRGGDTAAARRQLEQIRTKVERASVELGFLVPFYERNYTEAEKAMNDFAKEKAHPEDFADVLPYLAVATNTVEKRRASLLAALARNSEQIAKQPDSYNELQIGALLNAALGNKEEAIRLAKRSVALYPVSQDAFVGPEQLSTLATIYAWTGEKDLAFETLSTLVKVPHGLSYGDLKLDPAWDKLRDDLRFADLLAQAAKPFD